MPMPPDGENATALVSAPQFERNWYARSHRQMYEDIHGGLGMVAGESTMFYYDMAYSLLQRVHGNISTRLTELSAGWTGAAADGALATIRASADWAKAASDATIIACAQSTHQAGAYVDARNAMPEPTEVPDIAPGDGFPAARVIVDVVQARARAAVAHAVAADVMTTYESSTADYVRAMPAYPELPTATVTTSIAGGEQRPGKSQPDNSQPGNSRSGNPGLTGGERPGLVSGGTTPPPDSGTQPETQPGTRSEARQETRSATQPEIRTPPRTELENTLPVTQDRVSTSNAITRITPDATPDKALSAVLSPKGDYSSVGAQPIRGVTGGVPNERSNRFVPVAGAARTSPVTRGAGVASPGFVPGAKSGNDDKDHERKYVVLDDKHLVDGHPPVPPPVIGEDQP
jgi:hypothetical protein